MISSIALHMYHFLALVVEHDPGVASTLGTVLTRLAWRFHVVETTEEAREKLLSNSFHAVFVELCAHGQGGGRGVGRWIQMQCLDTVCFLVTGWKGGLEPQLLRRDGFCGVVRKPLNFNEIRDTILEQFG